MKQYQFLSVAMVNFVKKISLNLIFFQKELVKDGLRFPVVGLDNPSTVSNVLLQQPGKLKAKQIREGKDKLENHVAV